MKISTSHVRQLWFASSETTARFLLGRTHTAKARLSSHVSGLSEDKPAGGPVCKSETLSCKLGTSLTLLGLAFLFGWDFDAHLREMFGGLKEHYLA